ncbi:hypothetical protein BC830DRAFT_1080977 [Chytriomyces sp. MP71]|nr:hypothetical protein BC830DRAFT_1080977 [Chytriomyces sp. MP71]
MEPVDGLHSQVADNTLMTNTLAKIKIVDIPSSSTATLCDGSDDSTPSNNSHLTIADASNDITAETQPVIALPSGAAVQDLINFLNATPIKSSFENEQPQIQNETTITALEFTQSKLKLSVHPSDLEMPVVEHIRQMEMILGSWFETYDQAGMITKMSEVPNDEGIVFRLLSSLIKDAILRGGGAVARTAKLLPEIVKAGCISAEDVKERQAGNRVVCCPFFLFTKTFAELAIDVPNTFKYFGIFYGVMLVEFEPLFTLKDLADMVEYLVQDDQSAESMSALKVLHQALEAVSIMRSEEYLVQLYKRQAFDLKMFWPVAQRHVDVVEDWLESSSLDALLNAK